MSENVLIKPIILEPAACGNFLPSPAPLYATITAENVIRFSTSTAEFRDPPEDELGHLINLVAISRMTQKKTEKKGFFRKYFWEGQHLDESAPTSYDIPKDADFVDIMLIKYRKYVAVLIPLVVMQSFWWLTAIRYDWLSLYATHWQLPAIMLLGSTVADFRVLFPGKVLFQASHFVYMTKVQSLARYEGHSSAFSKDTAIDTT
ncbi:hypothetical protein ANCDUO_02732 [Ancylostoma duodenale]|uniref:Uncharacterized protein n=1 Tax=Ancylostoma duodenale TaxID=51022 RepID=A0A0C2H5Y7_9BILA|nr:hypothetical protein ANCDUO_02732 [Ancylostoma duodenale]